jgi:hypothetical protein
MHRAVIGRGNRMNELDMGEGVDLSAARFLDGVCPLEGQRIGQRSSYVACLTRRLREHEIELGLPS